jgi:hypothetical protein
MIKIVDVETDLDITKKAIQIIKLHAEYSEWHGSDFHSRIISLRECEDKLEDYGPNLKTDLEKIKNLRNEGVNYLSFD